MRKKHALILAFLLTGLIASNYYLFSFSSGQSKRETSVVKRVIDGDTLELQDKRRVRLLNINAPEKSSPLYQQSLDYLKQFENRSIQLEITETDLYGRSLARIYSPDYINLQLVEKGLASKFLVEGSELSIFKKAEEQAIKSQEGIWKHSQYYDCFTTEIDKYVEVVTITNECGPINLQSWTLKDESRKTYTFGPIQIQKIKLHSKQGNDSTTDIYWNLKTNVWNNDRDSLYLFDEGNNIVHHNSYGY